MTTKINTPAYQILNRTRISENKERITFQVGEVVRQITCSLYFQVDKIEAAVRATARAAK